MADLDDFFAKKDKKKSKKSKIVTPEIFGKNSEDTVTKRDIKIKTSTAAAICDVEDEEINNPKAVEQESEEEWREYEEQRKDYTGLKIGQLILNSDDEEKSDGGEDGYDGDHTNNDANNAGECPWKSVLPKEEKSQVKVEVPKKEGIYRPPGMLMAMKSKVRKAAPDLSNTEYFPTLGAARPEEKRKKKTDPPFEDMRNGGRMQKIKEPVLAPRGCNRFHSLDEVES